MQDLKKNLYTFNFKKDILPFLKIIGIFFIPVIVLFITVEILISDIPTSYQIIGKEIEKNATNFEVAVFGSSQMKNAINPKYLEKSTINLSSTSQHHNTDFNILKQTKNRFTKLKIVVLEISYGHFELPHNSEYFWKNNLFLKYYNVNNFGRITTFPDKLIFSSRPAYFSNLLVNNYIKNKAENKINEFGFDENNYDGVFKKLNYDEKLILKTPVKIEKRENKKLYYHNTAFFYKMLDYCKNEKLKIIICSTPTYKTYRDLRNTEVLKRRDSMVKVLKQKYPDILFFNSENDTDFKANFYKNENHLNPDGAKLYTQKLNEVINSLY